MQYKAAAWNTNDAGFRILIRPFGTTGDIVKDFVLPVFELFCTRDRRIFKSTQIGIVAPLNTSKHIRVPNAVYPYTMDLLFKECPDLEDDIHLELFRLRLSA